MPTHTPTDPNPSIGGLYVKTGEKQLAFPLKHTEVEAKIAGNLSRVEVTQTFENPFTEALEAIYVFPLPDEAAVDNMEIKIGDRVIKGNIKKREEAQAIYEQAKRQGRTAGLLEQERDNIFTQSLANIQPGEQIDVTIRYTDSLKFAGGDYEFVFPMVVGPRFIPGIPIDSSGDTDLVPDASRITPPIIPPATRSGHDIGVTVEIDGGLPISDIRSTSHQLRIEHEGQIVRVKLGNEDTIPNKDLILRYRVACDRTSATILTQSDERGGHFAIYFIPALAYRANEIVPKDVVFLMDTSGSQQGDPLRKCQELMRRFINGLNPDDTFTIIDFSDITTQLSGKPLPNTPENRTKAIDYINRLQANGGTYLLNGIRAVLNFPEAVEGRLRSIVLLTDGYIGNENEILAEVQEHLKPGNRLYSFGVGSSTNRFLLNRIAEIGRGTSRIIRHDEPTEQVANEFFRQINNPVLTNIQINWNGTGEIPVTYPSIAPDLFAEQPLVLFGRKQDRIAGDLHITGIAAGGYRYEQTFNLNFEETGNPAIAQLWGRMRIKDLMNQMFRYETKGIVEAVTETGLTYQLLSQYTAFVAVSDEVRVDPEGNSISMAVPIEMAEGVSYEGIYGGNIPAAPAPQAMMRSAVADVNYVMEERARGITLSSSKVAKSGFSSNLFGGKVNDSEIDCLMEAESFVQTPGTNNHPLQVVSATGLDGAAIGNLTQHLQRLHLPSGLSGEIVFELIIKKGRVRQVLLDENATTIGEKKVIEMIKKSLLTWQVPQSASHKHASNTVSLMLRVQS
ncbi:VIT domain-containing protein [Limnofasciculus baicalensis]|uniref:VIT domain-containing protein n=1 Tax=Limnofasciculus baicalensis BBK-W-15 TaxID=2699891 RepID=A0AAE3GN66_9CYAN|nr:VIT domain-containing protein [Limnofasciculus baicalensis]MCP2727474.1 VIT domain-containing protein [Limnofasciculus baicalensis BBK-W-15]